MNDNTNLQLKEIDGGRLLLQADEELKKVIRDIADPNKVAEGRRSVQITVHFAPSKSRRDAEVTYEVTSKTGKHPPRNCQIYLGKNEHGEVIAKPWVPNQQILPGTELLLDSDDTITSDGTN